MDLPRYVLTQAYFAPGILEWVKNRLGAMPHSMCASQVLFIGSQGASSAAPGLLDAARRSGAMVQVGIEANPSIDQVEELRRAYASRKVRLILAFGGGSVIDAAKALAILLRSRVPLRELLSGALPAHEALPLVAIPTTCGTGSEVTSTATLWCRSTGRKHSLESPRLYPALALVDPLAAKTLSARTLACCALDAMAHATEASWSKRATAESRCLSLTAVRLLVPALEQLCEGRRSEAEPVIARGALIAGAAIAQAGTTAAHALSYGLTAQYGLEHGAACALMLPTVVEHNLSWLQRGDPALAVRLLEAFACHTPAEAEAKLRLINKRLRITPPSIAPDALDVQAAQALSYARMANNPATIDTSKARDLLRRAMM